MKPTPPQAPRAGRPARGGDTELLLPARPFSGTRFVRKLTPSKDGAAALSIQRVFRGHLGRWEVRTAIKEMMAATQYDDDTSFSEGDFNAHNRLREAEANDFDVPAHGTTAAITDDGKTHE